MQTLTSTIWGLSQPTSSVIILLARCRLCSAKCVTKHSAYPGLLSWVRKTSAAAAWKHHHCVTNFFPDVPLYENTEESRNNEVPPTFPEGILVENLGYTGRVEDPRYTVDPDYRKKDSPGWKYFATKYLPCINAKVTNFRLKSHKHLLSEIFTASDEAYALALLINEYENYKFSLQCPSAGAASRPKKPFTNSRSGKTSGWNHGGLETYKSLVEQVEMLRNIKESSTLEHGLMQYCKETTGRVGPLRRRRQSVETKEFDFLSTVDKNSKIYKLLAGTLDTENVKHVWYIVCDYLQQKQAIIYCIDCSNSSLQQYFLRRNAI